MINHDSTCPLCKYPILIDSANNNDLFWIGCLGCKRISIYFDNLKKEVFSYCLDFPEKNIYEIYGHRESNLTVLKRPHDLFSKQTIHLKYIDLDLELKLSDSIKKLIKKITNFENFQ